MTAPERGRKVRQVLLWILVANWVVAAAKLTVGLLAHSAAVTADGLHSFIDGSSNIVGLVAMSIALRPADADHPYGHGKFEALAALAIGAMIGIGMLELGRMALSALIHNRHPEVSIEMAALMGATVIINLLVTTLERRYGKSLQSPLLLADSQHTLSDVFVSLAVLASLGLVWLGVPRADGAVALVVLGFVAYVAYGIVRHAVGILADSARLEPQAVQHTCAQIPGLSVAKNIRSRGMEGAVYVDLTIEVDPRFTTSQAHEVADKVEQALHQQFPEIVDVVVHVEPARSAAP